MNMSVSNEGEHDDMLDADDIVRRLILNLMNTLNCQYGNLL